MYIDVYIYIHILYSFGVLIIPIIPYPSTGVAEGNIKEIDSHKLDLVANRFLVDVLELEPASNMAPSSEADRFVIPYMLKKRRHRDRTIKELRCAVTGYDVTGYNAIMGIYGHGLD